MKKVYKLTVYRKPEGGTVWGGRVTKTVEGEYESKDEAQQAYDRIAANDPAVSGKAIAVDWR